MKSTCAARFGSHQFQRPMQPHQRRHEQRADDRRVEDDARRETDAELLDVDARARGQHEEREHQDQRGARDELAGPRKPERDRGVRVARLVVGLAHAGEHEDLVVHREAEQEREDHQRDPRDDRVRRVDVPDRHRAVALLEDEDDDPVRRAERDEVQHDRLQRQQQRAEGAREQEIGEQDHEAEHVREVAVDRVHEVAILRRDAAERRVGARERSIGAADRRADGLVRAVGARDRLDERIPILAPLLRRRHTVDARQRSAPWLRSRSRRCRARARRTASSHPR